MEAVLNIYIVLQNCDGNRILLYRKFSLDGSYNNL